MINETNTTKKKIWIAIAFISALTMIVWMCLLRFGMIMFFLVAYPLIILSFLVYFISLVQTVLSLFKTGFRANILKIILHCFVLLTGAVLYLSSLEAFKSEAVLIASFKEDLFAYRLTFRKDYSCEGYSYGFLGYEETQKGSYRIKEDTIIFLIKPFDDRFISDTLLWNRGDAKLYQYTKFLDNSGLYKDELAAFRVIGGSWVAD